MTKSRKLGHLLAVSVVLMALLVSATVPASAKSGIDHGRSPNPPTRFFVPKPDKGAIQQIASLLKHHDRADAKLIGEMILTPQAVWFNGGTPDEVRKDVKKTVKQAAAQRAVPVLVAYNISFRDCAQYSAGGATSVGEYKAWIDGFAAGISNNKAVVILEPDGLGIIPWYNPFANRDTWVNNPNYEWCQPAGADPATAAADRFAMLNYAVDKLKENPGTSVYLDGTHSAWLGAGDAADRLIQAGVAHADGFFLNVSNYRLTEHLEKYGTWVEKSMYGKKYMGTERSTVIIGPDGKVKAVLRKVQPAEHLDLVLEALG